MTPQLWTPWIIRDGKILLTGHNQHVDDVARQVEGAGVKVWRI